MKKLFSKLFGKKSIPEGYHVIEAKSPEQALATLALGLSRYEHDGQACGGCAMRTLAQAIYLVSRKQEDFTDADIIENITEIFLRAGDPGGFAETKH